MKLLSDTELEVVKSASLTALSPRSAAMPRERIFSTAKPGR